MLLQELTVIIKCSTQETFDPQSPADLLPTKVTVGSGGDQKISEDLRISGQDQDKTKERYISPHTMYSKNPSKSPKNS